MKYIPVSVLQDRLRMWDEEVEEYQRQGQHEFAAGVRSCADELRRILESATEGVTIEGFQVVPVGPFNGLSEVPSLSFTADEVDALAPFNGVEGTLIFIPDVEEKAESFRRVEEKQSRGERQQG